MYPLSSFFLYRARLNAVCRFRSEHRQLRRYIGFLPRFDDFIPLAQMTDQQRRMRIVLLKVLLHRPAVIIGVAVNAAMRAGIVHADVRAQQAIALRARGFLRFRHAQPAIERFFQHRPRHAA